MARGNQAIKSQERNAKAAAAAGKSPEERAAAKKKVEQDKTANQCAVCKQTFLVNASDLQLYQHVLTKHDKDASTPEKFFPKLKGYDPNAKAAPAAAAKREKVVEKSKKQKSGDDLSALLSEGLTVGKKKGNKK
tara:strand:- start:92 stop:493 length:402 start_codon:yes stop_codon:yes gene_type:complete